MPSVRASKCPATTVCVRAPIRVLRPSGAHMPQKGPAPVWRAHASKRSCAHSLRGNTFSGYKFENKRPPAQSPKMMIVRERPHSPNRTACTAHSVRRPRASPYHAACARARVPPRSRRRVPTRNEAGWRGGWKESGVREEGRTDTDGKNWIFRAENLQINKFCITLQSQSNADVVKW